MSQRAIQIHPLKEKFQVRLNDSYDGEITGKFLFLNNQYPINHFTQKNCMKIKAVYVLG